MADIDIEAPGADETELKAALRALVFDGLPTTNPLDGSVWSDAGTVKVSLAIPAGATHHVDLISARAWTLADGEVAPNTLLGEDANFEASWGHETAYDANKLTADGYTFADGEKVALIGALRTKVLAGAMLVFKFKKGATGSDGSFVMMSQGGENKYIELDFNIGAATNGKLEAYAGSGSFDLLSDADQMNKGEGVINKVGIIVVPASRFEFAANGRTTYEGDITTAEYPTSGAGEIICAGISLRDTDSLQSVTAYDAPADASGLGAITA